jgi:hypothetical protein
MRKVRLLAAASLSVIGITALAAAPAFAQEEAPVAPAGEQGVLVFTPDFFADRRPNTALDMVNRVPGFTLNNGNNARGFEGAVGNVLIDGARPATKNDTVTNALQRISADQVARIELIRGGAPGIDMQNYTVIANVILTGEASREIVATIDSWIYDGGRDAPGGSILYTQRSGDRSWTLRLADDPNTNDSNGRIIVMRVNGAGAILRDEIAVSDSWGSQPAARGTYNGPLAGGVIDLTARYALTAWNMDETQGAAGIVRDSHTREDGHSGELGATWERPLGERHKLEARLIHQFSDWDGFNSYQETLDGAAGPQSLFDYEGESSESIARALIRQERTPELAIEIGTEAAYNMRDTDQVLTIGGVANPLPSDSVKVEEIRGEGFARATWRPDPKWSLEAGMRMEVSEISQSGGVEHKEDFFFPKPRVLATWTPRPNDQIRLRLEREVGQLNFRDFAASAQLSNDLLFGGNVELVPDSRWIAEAVYERRFWGEGVVTIGYRHDEISDVIDFLPLPGGLSAIGNIGEATMDRISLNFVVPTDRMGVPGGRITFRNDWDRTRVTDPTTGARRRITNTRVSDARIGFEQDIPSWRLRWGVTLLPQYDRPRFSPEQYSTFRLSDYSIWFVEYKPVPSLSIMVQATYWDDGLNERVFWADRVTQTVAFAERRDMNPRSFYRLTIRKTF